MTGEETRLANVLLAALVPLSLSLLGISPDATAGEPKPLDLNRLFHDGIPPSPFANLVYRYADTMLERGRDTYGLHQNLLRLLYVLTPLSGERRYADAADDALKWFLNHTQSSSTALARTHELTRPWMLWPRCYELAPEASEQLAGQMPFPVKNSPRHAGIALRCWAEAYAYGGDKAYLEAIDAVLARYEGEINVTLETAPNEFAAPALLTLAIDADGAARKVPEPLRTRLTRLAERADEVFNAMPHDLEGTKGFVLSQPREGDARADSYTDLWDSRSGRPTTAQLGVLCVSRYENSGRTAYRELIVAAADAYLDSLPGVGVDAWPRVFGHAISLQLAAFRVTAREEYHKRAYQLGEMAVERFFGESPLPRASLKTDHYEATTGADSLALALVQLHLSVRHITAVRAPANAIDR